MLKEILSKFFTQYSDLLKFKDIEQFDEYYLKVWIKVNEEQEIYDDEANLVNVIEATNRSEIKNGLHLDSKDEKDRLAWLRRTLQISMLAGNITSPILSKENSLAEKQAMYKQCMSEFAELYKQINEKVFLVKKYPFILEELSKLKESVINKCGFLDGNSNIISSPQTQTPKSMVTDTQQKITWNAGVGSLATLIYDLMYEYKLNTGKPYLSDTAEVIIPFIHAHFCDEHGEQFELGTLKKYIHKDGNGNRVKDVKNNRVIVKKKSK